MPDHHPALEGLDPEQLQAVTAPLGPVCVLAGAGTGKTRTITRRIAHLIERGQVSPPQVLAVTFTARAAGEMRSRLRTLGIEGSGPSIAAQTFHAAAMRQLRYFWQRAPQGAGWELLDNKLPLVARAARRARLDDSVETVRDLASEIEWAKASLIGPEDYPAAVTAGRRETPQPAEVVGEVYSWYEVAKISPDGDRLLDFDDLLKVTADILADSPAIADEFRSAYRFFVVDEYQDITPLQQRLLDLWLGERDNLTVVGDANQTIYSFTGATAGFLLDFTRRYPDTTLVRLERDYRSTPEVVALANQVIGHATDRAPGTRLELIGQRPSGPAPRPAEFADDQREAVGVVAQITHLVGAGLDPAEVAILYRVNAQSVRFEEALTAAGIPYQVRGAAGFFTRTEIQQALRGLRTAAARDDLPVGADPSAIARAVLVPLGLTDTEPTGTQARIRWESLRALMSLIEEVIGQTPAITFAALVGELSARADERRTPAVEGVTLASLHAAKGLEWDAVFLVGLTEGSVPITQAIERGDAAVDEERRLFYVGITRAREHLYLSWSRSRSGSSRATRRRTRFLEGIDLDPRRVGRCVVCGTTLTSPESRIRRRCSSCRIEGRDEALVEALREWRRAHAERREVAEHAILTDAMLDAIAEQRPSELSALATIPGIGATKLHDYGAEVIALVAGGRPQKRR